MFASCHEAKDCEPGATRIQSVGIAADQCSQESSIMASSKQTANWSRRQLLQYAAAGAGLLPVLAAGAEPAQKESSERVAAKIAANEAIQRARQAALDVLKPKPKDLEHG